MNNIKRVITENNVPATQSFVIESNDACIEMETGTGKTLTYIQTAYELYKEYGFPNIYHFKTPSASLLHVV